MIENDLPSADESNYISPIHLSVLKYYRAMMGKRITALGFEKLKDSGTYPIVRSMSEIAGSCYVIAGQYLGSPYNGKLLRY